MTVIKEEQNISDNQMALDFANGNKEAFDLLLKRFSPRLRSFLSRRVPNPSDVEDILQDTFLKVYLNIESFDPKYKFSCWIFTIASRNAINHSRTKTPKPLDIKFEIVSQINEPFEEMIDQEQKLNLWTEARKLEEKQYAALYLKYSEDFTTEEIAKTLNTTKLNVRVLLHRARNNLIKITQRED